MPNPVTKLLRHRAQRILAACRLMAAEVQLQRVSDALTESARKRQPHDKRRELFARRLRAEWRVELCRAAYHRAREVANGRA